MRAAFLALLLASSALGAQSEASGVSSAYRFDSPLECGKHLLPPSVCYPLASFELMDKEIRRLQAVEREAQAAGDRRLTFFVTGAILGTLTGLLLGGYVAWLISR